jgi:hypothetical protein
MKKCEGSQELDNGRKEKKAEIKRRTGMTDTIVRWRSEKNGVGMR